MPFFSQHAGYIWLYGLILVQVVLLILPARWFVIPTYSESRAYAEFGQVLVALLIRIVLPGHNHADVR